MSCVVFHPNNSILALAHLSTLPDSVTQYIVDSEALAVLSILASGAFSQSLGILHRDDQTSIVIMSYGK